MTILISIILSLVFAVLNLESAVIFFLCGYILAKNLPENSSGSIKDKTRILLPAIAVTVVILGRHLNTYLHGSFPASFWLSVFAISLNVFLFGFLFLQLEKISVKNSFEIILKKFSVIMAVCLVIKLFSIFYNSFHMNYYPFN